MEHIKKLLLQLYSTLFIQIMIQSFISVYSGFGCDSIITRTPSILRQSDAPRGRDEVPDDRECCIRLSLDGQTDETLLSKSRHHGKK